jgi:hypothetical protein
MQLAVAVKVERPEFAIGNLHAASPGKIERGRL